MKSIFIFIVLFLTVAVNLPEGMLKQFGYDADILVAALVAVVFTGLLQHRQVFLIVLVMICALAVNVPEEMIREYGMNPDYILGVLVALIVLPVGAKATGHF